MSKKNLTAVAGLVVGTIALIAAADPVYYAVTEGMAEKKAAKALEEAAGGQEIVNVTGEAEGFGGAIKAEVALAGDKIIGLTLTGDSETPELGGAALGKLTDAILAAGTVDGVDAVSGATITSEGVFSAVKKAMGLEEVAPETEAAEAALPGAEGTTTVTGEAEGYEGPIKAEVTLDADGKIVGLTLTGDDETPELGGKALEKLTKAILEAGTIEGVDGVAGATWSSDGAFAAIKNAMGGGDAETVTGEADGFEGPIKAEVALNADGKIVGLTLTGDDETPEIGGKALEKLTKAILEAGTVEGVDGVAGATFTSDGAFEAIKNAMSTAG